MPFLKKRKSTIYTHSRSGSTSSIRIETTNQKNYARATNARNVDPANIAEIYTPNSESKTLNNDMKHESYFSELNRDNKVSLSESRKSSLESSNSLTSEKLLFTWDVTDPNQWTMTRVVQWLRSNSFSDVWISFFKRKNISGNGFLKLLAHDNFAQYEKSLPTTKYSNYERFQCLLKKTLEDNVIKGSKRNVNKGPVSPRSSSESATFKTLIRKGQTSTHIRSTSESALLNKSVHVIGYNNNDEVSVNDNINETHLLTRHNKTTNSSSLYRRSFISLRTSSSSKHSPSGNQPKITIPARPFSNIENSSKSPNSSLSPSVSQGYSSLFRRHKKNSSSESSLFKSTYESNISQLNEEERKSDSLNISTTDGSSPYMLSLHANDEKVKLWDKIKKKSSTPDPAAQIRSRQAVESIEQSPVTNSSGFRLPDKYYPPKLDTQKPIFLLLTSDCKTFIPFNTSTFIDQDISRLRTAIGKAVGKKNNNFTIHLTEIGSDQHGSAIPDRLLETLQKNSFEGTSKMFFINSSVNETVFQRETTKQTLFCSSSSSLGGSLRGNDAHKSEASSQSGDTSSDFNSLEDHSMTPRRPYPKTPSQYYGNSTFMEGDDYWSVKEINSENDTLGVTKLKQHKTLINTKYGSSEDNRSFRVIRKESGTDIDFNKRRESPYARVVEFEPKRDAPKPPMMGSQLSSTLLQPATISKRNDKNLTSTSSLDKKTKSSCFEKKTRPPPPESFESLSYENISNNQGEKADARREKFVQSYKPASTQVMIPQPYKGAIKTVRTKASTEELVSKTPFAIKNLNHSNSSLTKSVLSTPQNTLTLTTSRRVVSSAAAADNFDENEISFSDAPELSESADEKDDSSENIIWSKNIRDSTVETPDFSFNRSQTRSSSATESVSTIVDSDRIFDQNRMTLRPSAEVVYENLEKFFPDADLDNPILEGLTPPPSPNHINTADESLENREVISCPTSREETPVPLLSKRFDSSQFLTPVKTLNAPKRTKTIRIIAQEASNARRNKSSSGLRRKNTKMWGTRVVEITDNRMISINKSTNSKGEFKEFAWLKGEMIGKGSFGAVYLGLNVTTGEMIAVKQVSVPEFGAPNAAVGSMVDALKSEVSTLKDLDHLNIVQYLGFEEKNGIYSLFLEYVAGGSVGSLIRMNGPFDDQLIRYLTIQVLQGLSYLHSKGILHRDMKADNLLLDNDGVCKISDFGISKKSNNIYSNSDMTMRGTVFWMAPEMVDTVRGYSAKVDIWSLGCILLEMFAGRRPWSNYEVVAAMFQIGKSKTAPPIPEDTKPLVSKEGLEFLDLCFKIDPDLRPTAETLINHPFCKTNTDFDFHSTNLAKIIRSNDKLNSSRLRIESLGI